jgi:ubiquinone/menaquinone biosynthesis C-methylase UbiE
MSPTHTAPAKTHDICPYWLAGILESPLRRMLHNPARILSGRVSPGQTAMDLGCGPGVFTLELARLVGPRGCVIAVDMQPQMLDHTRSRAAEKGLDARLQLHQCSAETIGLDVKTVQVDFALAFYMIHEVPEPDHFLSEVYGLLKPGGWFLVVEPLLHVARESFQHTIEVAGRLGFQPIAHPGVAISRAILFQKFPVEAA